MARRTVTRKHSIRKILAHYHLTLKDCSAEISAEHLEEISHSLCEEWRDLPPRLNMKSIVKHDIDCDLMLNNEKRKRHAFLEKWNKQKGCEATYRNLIGALLDINCRKDAEGVCEILKKSIATRIKSAVRNGR